MYAYRNFVYKIQEIFLSHFCGKKRNLIFNQMQHVSVINTSVMKWYSKIFVNICGTLSYFTSPHSMKNSVLDSIYCFYYSLKMRRHH